MDREEASLLNNICMYTCIYPQGYLNYVQARHRSLMLGRAPPMGIATGVTLFTIAAVLCGDKMGPS